MEEITRMKLKCLWRSYYASKSFLSPVYEWESCLNWPNAATQKVDWGLSAHVFQPSINYSVNAVESGRGGLMRGNGKVSSVQVWILIETTMTKTRMHRRRACPVCLTESLIFRQFDLLLITFGLVDISLWRSYDEGIPNHCLSNYETMDSCSHR